MWRHPTLRPLSHDHHDGLVVALAMANAAADPKSHQSARLNFLDFWDSDFFKHLCLEEEHLSAMLSAELHDQMLADHEKLRTLAGTDTERPIDDLGLWLVETSQLLRDHIRWEERVVFPYVQEIASEHDFERLTVALTPWHNRRHERACKVRDSGANDVAPKTE